MTEKSFFVDVDITRSKFLTKCKISFLRDDQPHLMGAVFGFGYVTVARDWILRCCKRYMIHKCPVCGAVGGLLPVEVSAYFKSSASSVRLALAHQNCFNSLRDITPDIVEKMKIYIARFVAESEARFDVWYRAEFPNARNRVTGRR